MRIAGAPAARALAQAGRGVVLVEQFEPGRAEVDALDRPVVEARDPECAAVAHALAQDAPRVRQVAAVPPHRPDHVRVVVRLLLAWPIQVAVAVAPVAM